MDLLVGFQTAISCNVLKTWHQLGFCGHFVAKHNVLVALTSNVKLNSMKYGTRRFNGALKLALQKCLSRAESVYLLLIMKYFVLNQS